MLKSDEQPTVPFNLRARVERLEKIVCVLARGILLHEYSKDLNRGRLKEALEALDQYDSDGIKTALSILEEEK